MLRDLLGRFTAQFLAEDLGVARLDVLAAQQPADRRFDLVHDVHSVLVRRTFVGQVNFQAPLLADVARRAEIVFDPLQDLVVRKLFQQRPQSTRMVQLHALVGQRAVERRQCLLDNVLGVFIAKKTLVHLASYEPAQAVAELLIDSLEGRRLSIVDTLGEFTLGTRVGGNLGHH